MDAEELFNKRIKTLVSAAYLWGRINGRGRRDKNLNDFYETALFKQTVEQLKDTVN